MVVVAPRPMSAKGATLFAAAEGAPLLATPVNELEHGITPGTGARMEEAVAGHGALTPVGGGAMSIHNAELMGMTNYPGSAASAQAVPTSSHTGVWYTRLPNGNLERHYEPVTVIRQATSKQPISSSGQLASNPTGTGNSGPASTSTATTAPTMDYPTFGNSATFSVNNSVVGYTNGQPIKANTWDVTVNGVTYDTPITATTYGLAKDQAVDWAYGIYNQNATALNTASPGTAIYTNPNGTISASNPTAQLMSELANLQMQQSYTAASGQGRPGYYLVNGNVQHITNPVQYDAMLTLGQPTSYLGTTPPSPGEIALINSGQPASISFIKNPFEELAALGINPNNPASWLQFLEGQANQGTGTSLTPVGGIKAAFGAAQLGSQAGATGLSPATVQQLTTQLANSGLSRAQIAQFISTLTPQDMAQLSAGTPYQLYTRGGQMFGGPTESSFNYIASNPQNNFMKSILQPASSNPSPYGVSSQLPYIPAGIQEIMALAGNLPMLLSTKATSLALPYLSPYINNAALPINNFLSGINSGINQWANTPYNPGNILSAQYWQHILGGEAQATEQLFGHPLSTITGLPSRIAKIMNNANQLAQRGTVPWYFPDVVEAMMFAPLASTGVAGAALGNEATLTAILANMGIGAGASAGSGAIFNGQTSTPQIIQNLLTGALAGAAISPLAAESPLISYLASKGLSGLPAQILNNISTYGGWSALNTGMGALAQGQVPTESSLAGSFALGAAAGAAVPIGGRLLTSLIGRLLPNAVGYTTADYISKFGETPQITDYVNSVTKLGGDPEDLTFYANKATGDIKATVFNDMHVGYGTAEKIQSYLQDVAKTNGGTVILAHTSPEPLPNKLTIEETNPVHLGNVRANAYGPEEGMYFNLPTEGNQPLWLSGYLPGENYGATPRFSLDPFKNIAIKTLLSTETTPSNINLAELRQFFIENPGADISTAAGQNQLSKWLGEMARETGTEFHYPYQNYLEGGSEQQVMGNVGTDINALNTRTYAFRPNEGIFAPVNLMRIAQAQNIPELATVTTPEEQQALAIQYANLIQSAQQSASNNYRYITPLNTEVAAPTISSALTGTSTPMQAATLPTYDILTPAQQQAIYSQAVQNPAYSNQIIQGLLNSQAKQTYSNYLNNLYSQELGGGSPFAYPSLSNMGFGFPRNLQQLNQPTQSLNGLTNAQKLAAYERPNPNIRASYIQELMNNEINPSILQYMNPEDVYQNTLSNGYYNRNAGINENSLYSILQSLASGYNYGTPGSMIPYESLFNYLYQNGYMSPALYNAISGYNIGYPYQAQYGYNFPYGYEYGYGSPYTYNYPYESAYASPYPYENNNRYPYGFGTVPPFNIGIQYPSVLNRPGYETIPPEEKYTLDLLSELFPNIQKRAAEEYTPEFRGITTRPGEEYLTERNIEPLGRNRV